MTLYDQVTIELRVEDPEADETEAIGDDLRDAIALAVNGVRERHPEVEIAIDGLAR